MADEIDRRVRMYHYRKNIVSAIEEAVEKYNVEEAVFVAFERDNVQPFYRFMLKVTSTKRGTIESAHRVYLYRNYLFNIKIF
jgi:hypothetical protein